MEPGPEVATTAENKRDRQPSKISQTRFGRGYHDRIPSVIATVTSITGVLNLLFALVPRERHRLNQIHDFLPVVFSAATVSILAVSGLLLWRLGTMLRRRKRRAWRGAVVVYALLVLAHIGNGTLFAAVISFVILVFLLTSGSEFRAKPDPVSRWLAAKIAAQFMTVAIIWGMLLLTIGAGHRLDRSPSVADRIQEVCYGLVGVDGPIHYRNERFVAKSASCGHPAERRRSPEGW
jgi:lysyl-tRNA synthetase class 2